MNIVADFETINNPQDCRIWAYGYMEIGKSDLSYGNCMTDFIDELSNLSINETLNIWFHNLKFDGDFIVNYLMRNGYEWTSARIPSAKQFTTLIGDMGQWYSLQIKFAENTHLVRIYDSLKLINFSVDDIAKSFHLPIRKLKIDYNEYREVGHKLTKKEIQYLSNDIEIMSMALDRLFKLGLKRITAGSNALHSYFDIVGNSWQRWFPSLDEYEDEFIRKSYKGGWTYAKKSKRRKEIGEGIVLDVNSLYPSRMKNCILPYGKGTYFVGKYKKDKKYPLYVQKLECEFKLKKGFLPTIQVKNNPGYMETEYLESSNGEMVELTLTNVDLDLFFEHYEIKRVIYVEGYKYHATTGMFDEYINHWLNMKVKAEKENDFALRAIAKLMLNSLYGKFAKRPKTRRKYPVMEGDEIKYKLGELEDVGSMYIPVGTFITAHARYYTITSAQKNYDRFLYADTDSLHLEGLEIPTELHVDKYELGAWKHEGVFKRAKYIGAKCYVEEMVKKEEELIAILEEEPDNILRVNFENKTFLQVTCAGMPAKIHNLVTYESFREGKKLYGKLTQKRVKGGIVLIETTFEIKKRTA